MSNQRRDSVARIKAQGRLEEMTAKFKELDANGNGQLDFEAMRGFLKETNPKMSHRHMLLLFSRVDTDGSGQIEFEEFCEYVLSVELMDAKRKKVKTSNLRQWDGPEQLKVNGSWDRETRLALQEFLAVQETPTAKVVKPARFVNGQMNSSHIIVLQELLQVCQMPAALSSSDGCLACGTWTSRTTRALNEMLLAEGAPTALHIGEKFPDEGFGKSSVLALQEFLAMMRKGNGSALGIAQ